MHRQAVAGAGLRGQVSPMTFLKAKAELRATGLELNLRPHLFTLVSPTPAFAITKQGPCSSTALHTHGARRRIDLQANYKQLSRPRSVLQQPGEKSNNPHLLLSFPSTQQFLPWLKCCAVIHSMNSEARVSGWSTHHLCRPSTEGMSSTHITVEYL